MRKGTIFKYEFTRLLLSKEYLLLLAATLAYGVSLLRGVVLYGVNYTAPFSRLTFFTYCVSLAPFLFTLLLILCARQFKVYERGAESIIAATPIPQHVFRLMRYSAVVCAFLIAAMLPVVACFMFYRLVFDYSAFGALLGVYFLHLLPPSIFLFGASVLLGSRRSATAVYALLAIVFITSVFQITLPAYIDIAGSTAVQPLNTAGEDFVFSSAFIAGRVVLSVVGIVLIQVSLCQPKKRSA